MGLLRRARRAVASNRKSLCFGLVMFSSSAMNNLFVTLYLDYFINVVGLAPSAFYTGQVVFMLWNALNDVVFGDLSDRLMGRSVGRQTVLRRLELIRLSGYAWCAAFVLVWSVPLGTSAWMGGVHFVVVLCLYDGMLTMAEVNHSALLAEITTSGPERAKLNAYSAVCAGAGSLSSLLGHALWTRDPAGLGAFRLMTVGLALACAGVFHVACRGMAASVSVNVNVNVNVNGSGKQWHAPSPWSTPPRDAIDADVDVGMGVNVDVVRCKSCGSSTHRDHPSSDNGNAKNNSASPTQNYEPGQRGRRRRKRKVCGSALLSELLQQPNFWLFQVVYFLQAFDCTFEKNHFSLFLDGVAGHVLSRHAMGAIISASFVLPWVGTVFVTPLVQRHGLYRVVRGILLARVAYCAWSYALGPSDSPGFAAWFLLSNRVMSEAVCRICPLIMTNLVDEDKYIHRRTQAKSATIVGASTLLGKGSQSLAPMFGFFLLQQQQEELDEQGLQRPPTLATLAGTETPHAAEPLLRVLIVVPLLCVLAQSGLWSLFSLRGPYLKAVKSFANAKYEHPADELV